MPLTCVTGVTRVNNVQKNTPSIFTKERNTMATPITRRQATQWAINITAMLFFIVLALAPAVMAITATLYLEHVGGLIFLVGYWYVYDVIKGYFAK